MLALSLALAGEAVGVFRDLRRSAPVVGGILLLALITFGVAHGWSNVLGWLALIVPMALFAVVYITMFGLQARSRAEAQRLLHELETAHHQLAEYATQVENLTLTAERRRMARELHDTLAQGLAGLILQLEAADSHLSRANPAKAQQIIQQAMARARATLDGARQAIANLRAGPHSPSELEEAVRAEAGRFSDATGIPCDVDMCLPTNLPTPVAENALRAVSEGLANAAQHAKPSQVWLSLHTAGNAVEIRLRDDGVGFDPTEVAARGGHYGLIGLRERARLSGGALEVQSAPGEGTTLAMRLPLELEPEGESA
jgi:NarL family two-component system sensor histidine kinase YdfH